MAWLLDVHLYFTASFVVGGVHGLWRRGQLSVKPEDGPHIGPKHVIVFLLY